MERRNIDGLPLSIGFFVTVTIAIGAALFATAAPVSAESVEKSCRKSAGNSAVGVCGTWHVHDDDTGGSQDAARIGGPGCCALERKA